MVTNMLVTFITSPILKSSEIYSLLFQNQSPFVIGRLLHNLNRPNVNAVSKMSPVGAIFSDFFQTFFSDKQIQLLPDSCLSMSGWFWGLQINDLFSHSRTSFSTRRGWWILNYILIIIHQKPHSQQKIGSDSNLNWFSEVSEILSEYSI